MQMVGPNEPVMRTAREAMASKESYLRFELPDNKGKGGGQTALLSRHYYYRSQLMHRGVRAFLQSCEDDLLDPTEAVQILVLG
jgi:hypothetical protein